MVDTDIFLSFSMTPYIISYVVFHLRFNYSDDTHFGTGV